MSNKKQNDALTVLEFSRLTGFTKRWIYELVEQGFIPKPKGENISLSGAIQGVIKFYSRKKEPSRERLTKAQASREERKDRTEAGETIPSHAVTSSWENVVLILRERVMRIPNNLQSKCGLTESQRKSAEQESSDALCELQKKMVYLADQADGEEAKTA